MVKTRIALDIGTTSIGWALLKTDNDGEATGIIDSGVRIFNSGRDDKTEALLNQKRQSVRSARRRQDRIVQRRKAIIKYMVEMGLMPKNETERKNLELLNPYELRNKALNEVLNPHHIGRALFHLSQRRGFKSNRKSDGGNEGSAIKSAIAKTEQLLIQKKSKTIGQYLWQRQENGEHVKIRNISDRDKSFEFDFYLHREMLEQEFDMIWENQKKSNPNIYSDENHKVLKEVIFNQRPLKSKKEEIGYCTLFYDEKELRCAKALPSFQGFRIAQQLANLEYIQNGFGTKLSKLSPKLYQEFFDELSSGKPIKFKQMKTRMLKNGDINDTRESFNLESEIFIKIEANETANEFAVKKKGEKSPFLPQFNDWDLSKQNKFVSLLLSEDDDEKVIEKLINDFELSTDIAEQCLGVPLASGYGNLCQKACDELTDIIISQGLLYNDAVKEAYPDKHHSDIKFGDGSMDYLEYYAKYLQEHCTGGHGDENSSKKYANQHSKDVKTYGKIANPTVHIGLVQLQAVINDIIKIHGKPNFATVEFANDLKNNQRQKKNFKDTQTKNKKNNDEYRKDLENLGIVANPDNMLRMRLWNELDRENANNRQCPYTGTQISLEMVCSSEVEIEHILPYAKTLDDSPANKTLAMRSANRYKLNSSPYEAFGESKDGYEWDGIYTRAQNLPKNKKWRFNADAMDRYKENGTLKDRQLNDTRYLSKVAKKYLGLIIPPNNIHVIPGQLTSMLRGKWGLNEVLHKKEHASDNSIFEKNRNDHRHHAVDAIVVGCTTRGMLQKIATKIGRNIESNKKRLSDINIPWDNLINDVSKSIDNIVISYKPDRYKQGQLHEETFYGKDSDVFDKKGNVVKGKIIASIRVPLSYFENLKKVQKIKDEKIKNEIINKINSGDDVKTAVKKVADTKKIRHIKIVDEKLNLIKIGDKNTKGYERYVLGGNNWCIDIYQKYGSDKWDGEVIQTYYANQDDFIPNWIKDNKNAKRIMRLHINDLLEMEFDGKKQIMRLCKVNAKGEMNFAHHNEANVPSRAQKYDEEKNPLPYYATEGKNYLSVSNGSIKKYNPIKIDISPAGRIQRKPRK